MKIISKYIGTLALMSAGFMFAGSPAFAKVVVNVDNEKLDGVTTSATANNSVTFDASTHIVTLNNNHSSFIRIDCRNDSNVEISCEGENVINLILKGENKIDGALADSSQGSRLTLVAEAKISGDGSLNIDDNYTSSAMVHNGLTMDSGKIVITGKKEGIAALGDFVINNGSLKINTIKNAIHSEGSKLTFGVGTIDLKSTLESGILATNTNITISGGNNTIVGQDYGIKLTANGNQVISVAIDNGTTKLQGNEKAALVNYTSATENKGIVLGTDMYIAEDEVKIKSDGNSRYFAKGDVAVKSVTLKKLVTENEKNAGTGDNTVLYIAILAISATALVLKARRTSRF